MRLRSELKENICFDVVAGRTAQLAKRCKELHASQERCSMLL